MTEQELTDRIASCDLFRDLDQECLRSLAPDLAVARLAAGQVLLAQGDVGDCLYALVEGRLGVRIEHPDGSETMLDQVDVGEIVGEMSLLTGRPRAATVYALTSAQLVRLSQAGFDQIAARCPDALADHAASIALHFQRTRLAGVLANLVGDLDMDALHALEEVLEWQRLSHGQVLFERGDQADALYIVVNGRLRVASSAQDGAAERIVGEVGTGEIVGEFAFLAGDAHTATVYAIRETNVVKLTQRAFSDLIERYPQVMIRIARIIIRRQRASVRGLSQQRGRATTMALVPLSQQVQHADLARRLADALSESGAVLQMDSTRFDTMYGRSGAAQTRSDDPSGPVLVGWMSEQEAKYRYILYVADGTWSNWTQHCVGQADTLLLVGAAEGNPEPGPIEAGLERAALRTRSELVLVQPSSRSWPGDTASWLCGRKVGAHHHVRLNHDRDIRRLARRVTGRAVGLVLSGGGAKGFGHVGAIRALEEAGYQVDLVGGTSMGALVGGLYALGCDYERMCDLGATFARRQALFDYTPPLVSFLQTKKVTSLLQDLTEDVQIEDLWLPYFCVSCNLTEGSEVVHQAGPLWEAIRASLAIPGVFSPVTQKGDLLVDGGVINNFPIDVMREVCESGVVIGVNASPARNKVQEYHLGPSVSGWQVLWSRLNPFSAPMQVPSILASLMRTLEANSIYRVSATEGLADLVVTLPVEGFGTLDFASYERIIEIGYDTTRESLREWKRTEAGQPMDRGQGAH